MLHASPRILALLAACALAAHAAAATIVAESAIPPQLRDAEARVRADLAVLQRLAYRADFQYRVLAGIEGGDPNYPIAPSVVRRAAPLREPTISSAILTVARDGDRQTIKFLPVNVSKDHGAYSFAEGAQFKRDADEVVKVSTRDRRVTIFPAHAAADARPQDIWLPEDILWRNLGDDWLERYASLPNDAVRKALDKAVVHRSATRTGSGDGEEVVITDEFSLPTVRTERGIFTASRAVTYARAFNWRPRQVQQASNGLLITKYDVTWQKFGDPQSDIWLPAKLTVSFFIPKLLRQSGTEVVLAKDQTVTIDPASVLLGDDVAKADFAIAIPPGATTRRVTPEPKATTQALESPPSSPSSNSPHAAPSSRVLALTAGILVSLSLVYAWAAKAKASRNRTEQQ